MVHCLLCNHKISRQKMQFLLLEANPQLQIQASNILPASSLRPDGDVEGGRSVDYHQVKMVYSLVRLNKQGCIVSY